MGKNNADSKYPARTRFTCGGSFLAVSALHGWGLQGLAPSGGRRGLLGSGSGRGFGVALLDAALGSLPDTFAQLPVCGSVPRAEGPRAALPTRQRLGSGAAYGAAVGVPSAAVPCPGLRGAVLPWLRAAKGRHRCHRPPRAPGERGHLRRPPPAPFFLSVDENGALGPKGCSQRFVAGLQF